MLRKKVEINQIQVGNKPVELNEPMKINEYRNKKLSDDKV